MNEILLHICTLKTNRFVSDIFDRYCSAGFASAAKILTPEKQDLIATWGSLIVH